MEIKDVRKTVAAYNNNAFVSMVIDDSVSLKLNSHTLTGNFENTSDKLDSILHSIVNNIINVNACTLSLSENGDFKLYVELDYDDNKYGYLNVYCNIEDFNDFTSLLYADESAYDRIKIYIRENFSKQNIDAIVRTLRTL